MNRANPPAFPRPFSWDVSPNGTHMGDREEPHREQEGMSLRDYFAAHAPLTREAMTMERHCAYRWHYADAMLVARNAPPEKPKPAGPRPDVAELIRSLQKGLAEVNEVANTVPYGDALVAKAQDAFAAAIDYLRGDL